MYPRSGFWCPGGEHLNVPCSFRFLVPVNVRQNHPFWKPPFCEPPNRNSHGRRKITVRGQEEKLLRSVSGMTLRHDAFNFVSVEGSTQSFGLVFFSGLSLLRKLCHVHQLSQLRGLQSRNYIILACMAKCRKHNEKNDYLVTALSGPISRDTAILSLRYPISRDTF